MGIPDGAHTHGSSGGGLGTVVLVIVAAALLGPAVAAAVAELLHVLVIVAAVIGALVLAGGAAFVAFRAHRWRAGGTSRVSLPASPPWRAVQRPAAPRQVTGQPPAAIEYYHHIHLHGLDAADVADIIWQQQVDR
jgi:hypothetical protein